MVMEEKYNNYKVEVALKATFLFSSKKPLTPEQLVKKFRKQKFTPLDIVEETGEAGFLYVISVEPLEEEVEIEQFS
jgi:hypothetical protein